MKINNGKIWLLIEKLYIHCYGIDGFSDFLKNNDINIPNDFYPEFEIYSFMSLDDIRFPEFMEKIPCFKYYKVVKNVIFDGKIRNTQYSNWNYYGIFIKHWYPDLIKLLDESGITVDNERGEIIEEEIIITSEDFISYNFAEPLIENLKKEINDCYRSGNFLATTCLCRKLSEILLIRIAEKIFPKRDQNGIYIEDNHRIWYYREKGRYQSFERLMENMEEKISSFDEDKEIMSEIFSRLKIFKDYANKAVHYDFVHPESISELTNTNIDKTLNMLGKCFRKYCNY